MNLMFWRRSRTERVKALRKQLRETARELGAANAVINQHEATIKQFNNALQSYAKDLVTEQMAAQVLIAERDDALKRAADLAAKNVALHDRALGAEASLSGVREELRQERVARARDAEGLTAEGLGSAMSRLEIPGQRDGEVGS